MNTTKVRDIRTVVLNQGQFYHLADTFLQCLQKFLIAMRVTTEMHLLDARDTAKHTTLRGLPRDSHTYSCPCEVQSGPQHRTAGAKV